MAEKTYKYTDKNSGREIDENKIVYDNDDGVLEYVSGTAFRFIPNDNLIKELVNDTASGYEQVPAPEFMNINDEFTFDKTDMTSANRNLGDYYKFMFGFDSVEIKQVKPDKVSGFVSKEIEIGSCDYVEISTEETSGTMDVEYSVIDGLNEYPIVPVNKKRITKEKLFNGMNIRHTLDETEGYTVYCNNEEVSYNYTMLDTIPFNDTDNYSISYKPANKSYQVAPKNKTIKIKAICRADNENDIPPTIKSITILKYGGEKLWTI